jgi:predicted small secreted protein
MKISRKAILTLAALSVATLMSACGDTWHGAKKDTGENMNSVGSSIDRAGDRVKP